MIFEPSGRQVAKLNFNSHGEGTFRRGNNFLKFKQWGPLYYVKLLSISKILHLYFELLPAALIWFHSLILSGYSPVLLVSVLLIKVTFPSLY